MGQDGRWEGFATYLQEAIDDAGFATPTQFARRVNTDPSVVLRWLNGSARPTIRLLERVAPVLGVDINTMVAAAYPEASTAPPAKVAPRRAVHPLAAELDQMLAPTSPLDDGERQRVIVVVEAGVGPFRPKMRRRRAG
jgi:transcriptional regulator with XRE-family HTH domain